MAGDRIDLEPYERALVEETVEDGTVLVTAALRKIVEVVAPAHREGVAAAVLACAAQRFDGIEEAYKTKRGGATGRLMQCLDRWER